MNKVLAIVIGILIVGGVGWLAISSRNASEESTRRTQFEKAPDFALQDYDGKTVRFADFAGKPLVINSWAAWCPFCRKELVDFAAAQKEFSAEGGSASGGGETVAIIAIDRAESRETAKKYTDEMGVTNDLIFLLEPSDSFYRSIGGFSMPETIFVDRNGNIVERKRGSMEINEIREKIQKLLSS